MFDVIIIDPPPPVEAAGSSLLYSEEFYVAAKRRLKPNGILQAWFPGHAQVGRAALRSLCNEFTYVRCFSSIEGWGVHFLASMQPIEPLSAGRAKRQNAGRRKKGPHRMDSFDPCRRPTSSKSSPTNTLPSAIWILTPNSALPMISPTTSTSCCGSSAYSEPARSVNRAGSASGAWPAGRASANPPGCGPRGCTRAVGDGVDSVGAAGGADGEFAC